MRRLDTEVARQVPSQLVWLCEAHGVRTLYMEGLKSYQPPAGDRTLSRDLSSNLWAKVLGTTR
ncbi:MAG: hypothetical protein HXY34_01205 [Candidatus Thorarchaeota archaeon]|nr:hypothetical protein [Candidatus Thorarchaeota archaeon]